MSGIVYRSQKGSKLTSNEVDGNFQYLEGLVGGQGNAIITETGFSLVGQDLTINAGWEWKILNQSYSNASAVVLNIPLATSGNQRIDIVVANQSGGFERVSGIESNSNPTAPAVPTNKLVVTFLNVNDGEILDPDSPILGTQFKKKSESAAYNDPTLSGSDAVIPLQPNGQGVYAFSNAGLTSIDGFGLDLITGNPSAEVPYPGKDILIYNNKAGNLTLKHDGSGTADVKFLLEGGVDLIIPSGGKVWLKYGPSYCEMIFKSWSDVDDVIEGYFNGTNFYTDSGFTNLITPESGKIYVTLDTNLQYRWSGSAYVQIGGGKSQQIRAFYPSWNSNTLNTWRGWDRNTSNMLVSDANQSFGTGVIPSSFSSSNFILITNATKLKKVYWSLRSPANIYGQTIEIYIKSFTFNNNVAIGSETNNQVLIQESWVLANISANGYKDDFTIATHTLDAITGIQIFYRQTTGTVTAPIQGVQLILEFE